MLMWNPFKSKESKPKLVIHERPWVFIESRADWLFQENNQGDETSGASTLKFLIQHDGERVILSVKQIRGSHGETFDSLKTKDWKAEFGPLIKTWTNHDVKTIEQPMMQGSNNGIEISGTGSGDSGQLILRERRCVTKDGLAIITAIGAPSVFDKSRPEIDEFFQTVALK